MTEIAILCLILCLIHNLLYYLVLNPQPAVHILNRIESDVFAKLVLVHGVRFEAIHLTHPLDGSSYILWCT
jgi:hypothetical protein